MNAAVLCVASNPSPSPSSSSSSPNSTMLKGRPKQSVTAQIRQSSILHRPHSTSTHGANPKEMLETLMPKLKLRRPQSSMISQRNPNPIPIYGGFLPHIVEQIDKAKPKSKRLGTRGQSSSKMRVKKCSVIVERLEETPLMNPKTESQLLAASYTASQVSSTSATDTMDLEFKDHVPCSPIPEASHDQDFPMPRIRKSPEKHPTYMPKRRRIVNAFGSEEEKDEFAFDSDEELPDISSCSVAKKNPDNENGSTGRNNSHNWDADYKCPVPFERKSAIVRPRRINPERTVRSQAASEKENQYNISKDTESDDEEFQRAIQESRRMSEKQKRIESEASKLPVPLSGVPLTEEMRELVKDKLELPRDTKIVSKFRLTIKQNHLALFNEREWLEDPVIDFYLEMIKERNDQMRSLGFDYPNIYVFHGYFFKLCSKNEFEAVKEFTNENIFHYDLAFFPIIIRDHWRLVVADFKKKTLLCYDSLFRVNDLSLKTISKYLEQEYKLKVERKPRTSLNKTEPDVPDNSTTMSPESEQDEINDNTSDVSTVVCENDGEEDLVPPQLNTSTTVPSIPSWEQYFEEWTVDTPDPIITPLPQQNNGHDCGIFLCQYAEALARGVQPPFDFSQVNMLYFRYLMAYETIQGRLVDRGAPVPVISTPDSDSPST